MILAIDTSTTACSVALLDAAGAVVVARDEMIGRGHAERLVPMIADVVAGHLPSQILVGVGPGSFTGIRVGIAAAHGLAIGWDAELYGMSSLALLAAGAPPGPAPIIAAISGGHGELFAQAFTHTARLVEAGALHNASAAALAALFDLPDARVVGNAAEELAAAMAGGATAATELHPSARRALALPAALRRLPPKPLYARAPDAKPAMPRPQPAVGATPLALA